MRVLKAIKYDMMFQFRHGFYYVYIFVSVLYVGILRLLPEGIRPAVATLIIFSDPSILGFFFIGGIVFLEKGQKTLESLFVTPLQIWEYFVSKIVSLTAIALIMSYAIMLLICGTHFNPVTFFIGITLSSAFFTLVGFIISTRAKNINAYLLSSPLFITVFFVPVLHYFGILKSPLFYTLPTEAGLMLMGSAFKTVSIVGVIYAIVCLAVWIGIAYLWAHKWFYRYIILRIGEG